MPWPSKITRAFATVEEAGVAAILGNQYHGPYNKLLYTLFPADSDFIVSPNYMPDGNGDVDSVVSFEISLHQHPALVLQVKPPRHLSLISTRERADRQVRRRLADLSEYAVFPVLFGISAIGTRLCFYECERARMRLTPRRIPSDLNAVIDLAPRERWDCDVLEADGEQRLRALAAHITSQCEYLEV